MKILNWFLVILGIFGLISVRMLEDKIFYDPFLEFFHRSNKNATFPGFEWGTLIVSHFFRFALNLFFSAVIVQFIFKNKQWTIQAVVLMLIVFAITLTLYLYCLHTKFEIGYLFSFYMRRFVIQPLILLLIIPIFYYRKAILERQKLS